MTTRTATPSSGSGVIKMGRELQVKAAVEQTVADVLDDDGCPCKELMLRFSPGGTFSLVDADGTAAFSFEWLTIGELSALIDVVCDQFGVLCS
jgi:hypothetical protein